MITALQVAQLPYQVEHHDQQLEPVDKDVMVKQTYLEKDEQKRHNFFFFSCN